MDSGTLARVMGNVPGVDYGALAGPFNDAMVQAGCTTVNRAAMFCAQLGHESVGLRYMREIASGVAYEGRRDLGNVYPGDGVRYAGRGPIQITGRNNYGTLSAWAHGKGYVQSRTYFVDNPAELEKPRYGFLGAVWYWTVARPQINGLSDARNLEAVTRAINGGLNGFADRQARYGRALAMGEAILPSKYEGEIVEKRLDYVRDQVAQDTFYNCGPASCQTIIRAATGRLISEPDLGRELRTHTGGTDWIGQFPAVLNRHLPGSGYRVVEMPNDPPSQAQKERLWADIRHSVDGGRGVVVNIVAPPSNYPRASYTSTASPAYGGGTVYHYFAAMGYAVDRFGARHVWIADSGFAPYGYWVSLDQLATLIPPKGYCFAADVKPKIVEEDMNADQNRLLQEIWDQLRGPGGKGWPQLGQNEKGQNLTVIDAIAALRADVDELKGDK